MIQSGSFAISAPLPLSTRAVLASKFMADDQNDTDEKSSLKSDFDPDAKSRAFFHEDDFDIYVNKITNETYIFHGPDLPHPVERLEYDPADHSVMVVTKDGQNLDLGVKIQWMIRPYFEQADMIYIIQTKDGESIGGVDVPLVVKETKETEA